MRSGNLTVILAVLLSPVIVHAAELGPCTDVAFVADADGTTQRYVLRLPAGFNASEPHDLLIALHGHGSDRWQFASSTAWNECIAVRDFAGSRNMIFVSPDYRAPTSWMGPLAEKDVVQIIEDFRANYLINRVFICGGSMGGSSALTFTAIHPTMVDGVIALNPTANHLEYENFQPYISASFGGSKQQIPHEYKKRSAEYWPERFHVPVGISTGGQDTIVPPDSALRLASILSKTGRKVKSIYRASTGHSTTYDDTIELLTFVVDASVNQNIAVSQLYGIPGGGLVYKYPGVPGAPSSGSPDLQYIIGTTLYDRGVSICANGAFRIMLDEPASTFNAEIGLYSGVCSNGDVTIKICESGNEQNVLWQSQVMLTGQQAVPVGISIPGINAIDIIVDKYDADNVCDSVIFGNARIVFQNGPVVYLDEAQGNASCVFETDVDGDCRVDLNDLFLLAQDWLECGYAFPFLCNN
jgi:pimeloyl-ACP methyl ester carboxylesterase